MALSPYLLTTRELPAMVAALLGQQVVTTMPVPADGALERSSVLASFRASPRYLRLLESWGWSGPLFRAGVLASVWAGEDPMSDARQACAGIAADERFAGLRPYLHEGSLAGTPAELDELCADMLKGGPDPGMSIPIHAGLDRLASRHGLTVVRQGAGPSQAVRGASAALPGGSLAQRAEEILGRTVSSVAIPVLTACGGETMLEVRELLDAELKALRAAIDGQLAGRPGASTEATRHAARQFADAFASDVSGLVGKDDERGERITAGMARLACRRLPSDAVLSSSTAALRQFRTTGMRGRAGAGVVPTAAGQAGPVVTETTGGGQGTISAIVVTPLHAAE